MTSFTELEKEVLKFIWITTKDDGCLKYSMQNEQYWKFHNTQSQIILQLQNYKTNIRNVDQLSSLEDSEINPYIYSHMIF